jgi:hypothetical protein
VILAVTVLVFCKIRDLGMMGYDSYPLILTARIDGLADLFGTFTEQMMDGRYHGEYYRPLLNLSFAADHWFFGLDAWGYQMTGALLFGLTALAVWLLSRRLLGGGVGWGSMAALLFFLLHDSHFEVVPVPARRPEILCALFACVALWTQLTPRWLEKRWPIIPAVLMALAAASKETGYVLPAIACLAVYLYSQKSDLASRLWQVARVALIHSLLIGTLLGLRFAALGGLGGPAPLPQGYDGPGSLELSGTLLTRLLAPQNFMDSKVMLGTLGFTMILTVILLGALPGRQSPREPGFYSQRCACKTALVSLAWMALVGLLYGVSRSIEQWYLFIPVVGMSLFLGAGVRLVLERWRRGDGLSRGIAIACGLVLMSFCFFQLRYSPLYHSYPEWILATEASEDFLDRLAERIEATEPGAPIKAPPLPMWYPPGDEGPAIRGAAILDVYSVQAWAELSYPERKLRVLVRPPQTPLGPQESAIQVLRPRQF